MTIEAVLFDLHGVITSSPWSALAAAGTASGASEDDVLAVMLGDYANDDDHPWHRLERGEIGLMEYLPAVMEIGRTAGIELDFTQLRGLTERITVNDAVVARIRSLREDGLKVALVTNNVKEFAGGWREMIDPDELFDVIVDSSAEGVRKPNPAIFALALERLGVDDPSHAVFLDDAPGNVDGAARAGLQTILVEDAGEALAALDALLAAARATD